jgi:hypothetical protein
MFAFSGQKSIAGAHLARFSDFCPAKAAEHNAARLKRNHPAFLTFLAVLYSLHNHTPFAGLEPVE